MWSSPKLELGAIIAALVLFAAGISIFIYVRRKPKDKEQRRRLTVNLHGRLGDATITDLQSDILYYSYSVRGVAYTASQDISKLQEFLPSDPERLIGQVASLKYSPQNPANSIVLCEQWSGLRGARATGSLARE